MAGDNDLLEIVDAVKFPHSTDGNGILPVADFSARRVVIRRVDLLQHRLDRNAVDLQLLRKHVNFHRAGAGTDNCSLRHAVKLLQLVHHEVVHETAHLLRRTHVRSEGVGRDSLRRRIKILHRRLVDIVRQTAAHRRDLLTHFASHRLRVDAYVEFQHRLGKALADCRGDGLDAGDLADTVLDGLRDQRFHFFRRSALVSHRHAHQRQIDVGIKVDAEFRVRAYAENDQHEDEHRREYGPLDKGFNHK